MLGWLSLNRLVLISAAGIGASIEKCDILLRFPRWMRTGRMWSGLEP